MAEHTPGPAVYQCARCGWQGKVNGRPRCLRCAADRQRRWRQENPDKAREQRKKWRSNKGSEYDAKRKRIRRSNNPQTAQEAYKRRADWLKAGDVTGDDLREVYERDSGLCVYCAASVRPRFSPSDPRGFDHVLSRANGGSHTKNNLVVSCASCNAAHIGQGGANG